MIYSRTFFGISRLGEQAVEGTMCASEKAGKDDSCGLEAEPTADIRP
jgi:hypothetical protein